MSLIELSWTAKKKSLFSEFKNAKLKGKRIRRHVFTCFVRCTLKNFLFICRGEIELVKCSLHIPLLNLSQSLITYWQYIGATVVVEDFVPKFRKSLSHQEFQPHPVHPNYENNTWSKTNNNNKTTTTHDSFRYNQIKIYLTPSNTFPSHSRLLPLSVCIDPSPSIISLDFLLWAETSWLFIHTSMLRGIKGSWAWWRWVDLDF